MPIAESERDEYDVKSNARSPGEESVVNISCLQFEPKIGELSRNREESIQQIERAISNGGDFIVLPELANSGYVFNSRKEAYALSEPIPEGKTAQQWIQIAQENDIYIVGGYAERDEGKLFNSAIFAGPEGYIGKHRKLHLWNEEKLWFEPGNDVKVFETKIGRVGIQICYDQWFPELSRIQAMKGADIVAEPTNWVPINEYERSGQLSEGELARANNLAISNAHVNTIWFACANRIGTEREQPFLGRSLIVDPAGNVVAGPASQDDEDSLLVENCNLMESRTQKNWNELNVIPQDRRTDIYDELVGFDDQPHSF